MSSPLVPCPQCARHVFAGGAACPFCASALPVDLAKRAVPAATAGARLSRSALFAFATSAAVACSSGGSGSIDDAGSRDGSPSADSGVDTGGPAPAYGQPIDDGGVGPLYGAPADAGEIDSGGGGVLYGLPPADAASE